MRMVHEILRSPSIFDYVRAPVKHPPDRALESIVRKFGYGTSGCTVENYWNPSGEDGAPQISVEPPSVKWIGVWCETRSELLLVLVNWASRPSDLRLAVHHRGELLAHLATDAETGVAFPLEGQTLTSQAVRLLHFRSPSEASQPPVEGSSGSRSRRPAPRLPHDSSP